MALTLAPPLFSGTYTQTTKVCQHMERAFKTQQGEMSRVFPMNVITEKTSVCKSEFPFVSQQPGQEGLGALPSKCTS
jgi:hypothetical protein